LAVHWRETSCGRTSARTRIEEFMNRTDVLLISGVGLSTRAFQRLQDNAVDTTRRNIVLSARRHVGRSRRLVRDTGAVLQLVIAVVMLTQGIRVALRQWSATDDIEGVTVGTDLEPVA
jgi:hypothetical protein